MKRSCKHIDITQVATIRNWVSWCVSRHYKKRVDFKRLMKKHRYNEALEGKENEESWWQAIDSISLHMRILLHSRCIAAMPTRTL